MKIFRAILAPLAFIAFAVPTMAAEIPLSELSRYLNSLGTAEAQFTQYNTDGSRSTGTLYLKRPGRARFEYDKPNKALVMAGAGNVAIFDDKSNQPPDQYPLRRTPLNLILAQKVDLAQARMIVGHREVGDTTRVTAQDPKNPEYGTIELVFTANPTTLRAWVITDDQGGQTRVELSDLQSGGDFPARLFDIAAETERRLQ